MTYTPAPRDPKTPPIRINLLSDTQTRPTPAMREAMARAEVGDEQIGDDPTVNVLCERVADLLGKQAAVFMPSGTMCNVAATLAHCRPGDEILAHETAHIIAPRRRRACRARRLPDHRAAGHDGQFTPDTFRAALHPRTRYEPPQTVVSVEQTANIGGGTIWTKADLDAIARIAKIERPGHPYGRRAAAERLRRHRHRRARHGRGLGFGLDRFLQGPRRADRRGDGRLARFHRRGLALEAAARRLDAAVRHLRRGLRLRARPSRRPARRRSRQCPRAGARAIADRRHRGAAAETNLVFFDPDRRGRQRRENGRRPCASAACCSR